MLKVGKRALCVSCLVLGRYCTDGLSKVFYTEQLSADRKQTENKSEVSSENEAEQL